MFSSILGRIDKRIPTLVIAGAIAAVLLLLPGSALGVTTSVSATKSSYLLGEVVKFSGQIDFSAGEVKAIDSVGFTVSGNQGVTQALPAGPGTYTYPLTKVTAVVTWTNIGAADGYGYGYNGYMALGSSVGSINYAIEWDAPVLLDPPPTYSLLPNTVAEFDVPTLTAASLPAGLPDPLPALTDAFDLPALAAVDPNAPDPLPTLTVLANAIPKVTADVVGAPTDLPSSGDLADKVADVPTVTDDLVAGISVMPDSTAFITGITGMLDIDLDSSGNIYVLADGSTADTITKYDSSGTIVSAFGTSGVASVVTDGTIISSANVTATDSIAIANDKIWVVHTDNSLDKNENDGPKRMWLQFDISDGSSASPCRYLDPYGPSDMDIESITGDGDDVWGISAQGDIFVWDASDDCVTNANGNTGFGKNDKGSNNYNNGDPVAYANNGSSFYKVSSDGAIYSITENDAGSEQSLISNSITGFTSDVVALEVDSAGAFYIGNSDSGTIAKTQGASTITTSPRGLAYDSVNEYFYLLVNGSGGNDRLIKLDSSGSAVGSSIDTGVESAEGVAYQSGSLWLSFKPDNQQENRMKAYDIANSSWGSAMDSGGHQWGPTFKGITSNGSTLFVHQSDGSLFLLLDTAGEIDDQGECNNNCNAISSGSDASAYHSSKGHYYLAKNNDIGLIATLNGNNTNQSGSYTDLTYNGINLKIKGMTIVGSVIYFADDQSDQILKASLPTGETTDPQALASDGTFLWVVTDGTAGTDSLLKLNESTGAKVAGYSLQSDDFVGATYMGSSLYLLRTPSNGACQIQKIDPSDGSYDGSAFNLGNQGHCDNPGGLTNDGSLLWVSYQGQGRMISYDTSGTNEGEKNMNAWNGSRATGYRSSGAQFWQGKGAKVDAFTQGSYDMDQVSGAENTGLQGTGAVTMSIKGMSWDGDVLYVADDSTDYIYKTAAAAGSNDILGIANDGTDLYILVNNSPNDSIMKVSTSGTKDTSWATNGVLDTDASTATGITIVGSNLWVVELEQGMGMPSWKFYSYAVSNGTAGATFDENQVPMGMSQPKGLATDGTNIVVGHNNMGQQQGLVIYDTSGNSTGDSITLDNMNAVSGLTIRASDPQIIGVNGSNINTFGIDGTGYDNFQVSANNINGATAIGHVLYIGESEGNTVKKAAIPLPTSVITQTPKGLSTNGTDFFMVIEASPKDYVAKVDTSGDLVTAFGSNGYVQVPTDGVDAITYHDGAIYVAALVSVSCGMGCSENGGEVYKLNASTGAEESSFTLPGGCNQGCVNEYPGMASYDDHLWIVGAEGGQYGGQARVYKVDPENSNQVDTLWMNGANSASSFIYISDQFLLFDGSAMKQFEEQYGNLDKTGPTTNVNGVTDVTGTAYIGTTLYLADSSGTVKGTTLPTNIPELTIVGSYASTLKAVTDGTEVTSSASNFTVGKIGSTDILVTSPLTGFSVFTPSVTITGTVNDPAVETVSVGVDLPFTELFTDGAENGSTSEAKFTKTGLWDIACDEDVSGGDAKTESGDCAWYYGDQNSMNYDTGNNSNAGTLQIATDLAVVSTDINFSFSTWWDTEPGVQYDRKLVEIKEAGGSWMTVAAILGPYDLNPENNTPWDVPNELNSVTQWLGVPQAKMQGPGMSGCPPYCQPNPGFGGGGGQPAMEEVSVNLAPYNGKTISIRFKFDTIDGYVNGMEGWWIDDIAIGGAGFLGVTSVVTPVTDATNNNNGVYGSYSVVFALAEGINTIKVASQNPYDTTMSASKEIQGFLDTTPPTIDMDELQSPTKSGTATVSGEIGDINFQELTITQETSLGTKTIVTVKTLPNDGLFSKVAGLVEGTNTFTATAKDGAGLEASATVTVILDTVGPVLTVNDPSYPIGAVSARQGEPVIFSVDALATGAPMEKIEIVFPGNGGSARFKASSEVPEAIRDLWAVTGDYISATKIPETASPGEYSLTIKAYDTAGNITTGTVTASVVASLEGYNINLMPDWNLVSLPLMPNSGDIATMTSNTVGIQSIWYYDATKTLAAGETASDRWLVYTPSTADQDTLSTLQTGRGYWFKMDPDAFTLSSPLGPGLPHTPQAIKMTYSGEFVEPGTLPPSYEVVAGWNAMGFHSENELPVTTALQSLESPNRIWGSLLQYNNRIVFTIPDNPGEEPFFEILLGAFQRLLSTENLTPGYGYWIFMVDDGVITP